VRELVLTFIVRIQNNGVYPKRRRKRERRPKKPHDETVASKWSFLVKARRGDDGDTEIGLEVRALQYAGMRHSLVAAVNEAW
jgi:hypothetical protein